MNPVRVYDYLTQSRDRVLNAARALSAPDYHRQFNIGLKSIASTLTHIMISEWYYIERFLERPVPPYADWPLKYQDPPALSTVEATWREQAKATRAVLAAERDWNRRITYDSFPDDHGRRFVITATSGDIATQLALHEVHHRAQLMAMIRELGSAPPLEDLDYNEFMYERRPLV